MKRVTLIAVLIIVLVLCAVIPLATTAKPTEKPALKSKPTKTTITEKIYIGHPVAPIDQNQWVVSKQPIGKITLNTQTGEYSIKCEHVPQGTHYLSMLVSKGPCYGEELVFLGTFTPDAKGHLSVSGITQDFLGRPTPSYWDVALQWLSEGGSFFFCKDY